MIRFYNGHVLRFEPEMRLTADEVWTEGNRIRYVGPAKEEAPSFERQIDLRGDLLMPGFKNAHTHTAMTFLRSLADDMELQSWLRKIVWPNEAKLTDDAVYALTKLGILEYLSSGVTASFDMYVHNEAYAKANVDAGFRTVICSGLNNFDADIENIEREYLRFNHYHELVSYMLGIHAEYTTSLDRMEYCASLAEKYKAPCFTHLCETKKESEDCIKRYGMSATLVLDKIGFFRYGGGTCYGYAAAFGLMARALGEHAYVVAAEINQFFGAHGFVVIPEGEEDILYDVEMEATRPERHGDLDLFGIRNYVIYNYWYVANWREE